MRSRIRLAVVGATAVALLASAPTPSLSAAVKVGQACKKAGQKSGPLVCTKVGNKLVFRAAPVTTLPPVAAPTTVAATAVTATTTPPAESPLGPTPANVKKGGTLRYIRGGDIITLDPARSTSTAEFTFEVTVFDTLLRLDKTGNYAPAMAQGISSADNGRTWVLKLRPGVKFSDGTPYDAAAVLFNLNRFLDPKTAYPLVTQVSDIASMRVIDPLTLEITLKKSSGSWPLGLADNSGMMVSPKALQADPTGFGSKPVGAGPMLLKEWVRDDHMDFVKNPDFWDKDHIYLDGIRMKPVVDGLSRAQTLLTNQADVIDARVDQVLAIQGNKGTYIFGGETNGGYFLIPNMSKGPAKDKRIREALTLMIEPAKVNKVVFNGIRRSEKFDCPPFTRDDPLCVPGLYPETNIDRARQLVAQYKAEGNSLDLDYLINPATYQLQGEYLLQAMQNIGLNPKARSMTSTVEWVSAINAGSFDVAVFGLNSFPNPYPALNSRFESTGRNLPKHNLPELDAALRQGSDGATLAIRTEGWKNFQRIMAQNFVIIWLAPYVDGYALQNDVQTGNQPFTPIARPAEFYFSN